MTNPFLSSPPFSATELTRRFERWAESTGPSGYAVRCGPTCCFIARRILDVPVDDLSRLLFTLPVEGQRLMEIGASLVDYRVYLTVCFLGWFLISATCLNRAQKYQAKVPDRSHRNSISKRRKFAPLVWRFVSRPLRSYQWTSFVSLRRPTTTALAQDWNSNLRYTVSF
jgi:hypothetical protein